jgi:hypothetical protein
MAQDTLVVTQNGNRAEQGSRRMTLKSNLTAATLGILATLPLSQLFAHAGLEVCGETIWSIPAVASWTDFDAFDTTQLTKPRRPPSSVTGLATSYTVVNYYNFADQEVCDKLERSIFVTVSGTEGMEQNNKNEPWYWTFSHNRPNIVQYYPECMI